MSKYKPNCTLAYTTIQHDIENRKMENLWQRKVQLFFYFNICCKKQEEHLDAWGCGIGVLASFALLSFLDWCSWCIYSYWKLCKFFFDKLSWCRLQCIPIQFSLRWRSLGKFFHCWKRGWLRFQTWILKPLQRNGWLTFNEKQSYLFTKSLIGFKLFIVASFTISFRSQKLRNGKSKLILEKA